MFGSGVKEHNDTRIFENENMKMVRKIFCLSAYLVSVDH